MSSICAQCRGQEHEDCVDTKTVKDPAPMRYGSCFCQCAPLKADKKGKHRVPQPEITKGADE